MGIKSVIDWSITILFLTMLLWFAAGELFGVPFLIGYVETGSMEPTIPVNDGYIALPASVAGDVGEGDVVTFEAQHLEGGGPTTHRITEETEEGFITRGDGNSFDDQEAGEPPVQESQISAVIVERGDDVVTIPRVGVLVGMTGSAFGSVTGLIEGLGLEADSVSTIITGIGIVLVVLSVAQGFLTSKGRSTTRQISRPDQIHSGWILLVLVCIVSAPILTGMALTSGSEDIRIVSAESADPENPNEIEVGGTTTFDYEVENPMGIPRIVFLEPESSGVAFEERVLTVNHGETVETTLEVSAPDETGAYVRSRGEYQYFNVLPQQVIELLHGIHPWVAMSAITLVLISPLLGLFLLLVGFRQIPLRSVHD